MSAAADRVIQQLNARRVRDGEFRARCPVHQGQSDTSLSIKNGGDRALIHCHAGCSLDLIISALGMKSVAELFDTALNNSNDPEVQRQLQIERGKRRLQEWCERRLAWICAQIRQNEKSIATFAEAVSMFEDGIINRDEALEAQVWDQLTACYHLRTDLEIEFHVLNGSGLEEKCELYRRVEQHV